MKTKSREDNPIHIGDRVRISFKKFPPAFRALGTISAIDYDRRNGKTYMVKLIDEIKVNPGDIETC